MGFKEDAEFARNLSMGVVGAIEAARDLTDRYGHHVVPVERQDNKKWETRIKRLRLPDLVCVRCGRRVESRGKTNAVIALSDSTQEERAWDAGGTRENDLFAFVGADMSTDPPTVGTPVYFEQRALREVRDLARESGRKAVSEGSEVYLTWPAWVPSSGGIILELDAQGAVRWEPEGQNPRTYGYSRNWPENYLYVDIGMHFPPNTIVAGVVEPPDDLACPGLVWDIGEDLHSDNDIDCRIAATAARALHRDDLAADLEAVVDSEREWPVRLDALVTLALLDPEAWTPQLEAIASDTERPVAEQMQAVFGLSELGTDKAAEALDRVRLPHEGRNEEVRAAAVWGLGTTQRPRPDLLLEALGDESELTALHAIVAMEALNDEQVEQLRAWLDEDSPKAGVAARVLARHRCVGTLLNAVRSGGRARLWALHALGHMPRQEVERLGRDDLSRDIIDALEPQWIAADHWVWSDYGDEGLEALGAQTLKFDPPAP